MLKQKTVIGIKTVGKIVGHDFKTDKPDCLQIF